MYYTIFCKLESMQLLSSFRNIALVVADTDDGLEIAAAKTACLSHMSNFAILHKTTAVS
jgi:hypothetical protein